MFWFDGHVHLSSYKNPDRDQLIEGCAARNILGRVMAGYDAPDWDEQLKIKLPNTYRSFGLHPWQVLALGPEQVQKQMQHLSTVLPEADFMGETGLDGFRAKTQEQQNLLEEIFRQHLDLNRTFKKPLMLHIVKDHKKAQSLLKSYPYVGLVHGYSGSWEMAQKYIEGGFLISVGRGVYSRGYKSLKETVAKIPLDSLVIESDAVADSAHGPEDVVDVFFKVVQAVCEIKNISQEKLQETVFRNINRMLSREPEFVGDF
jgi:TatD DNase family protein